MPHRELEGRKRDPAWPGAEEIVQHICQCGAGGSNILEGHTGDVFVANSGKMAQQLAGGITEYEPRITLVGQAGFDLDVNSLQFQESSSLLENT